MLKQIVKASVKRGSKRLKFRGACRAVRAAWRNQKYADRGYRGAMSLVGRFFRLIFVASVVSSSRRGWALVAASQLGQPGARHEHRPPPRSSSSAFLRLLRRSARRLPPVFAGLDQRMERVRLFCGDCPNINIARARCRDFPTSTTLPPGRQCGPQRLALCVAASFLWSAHSTTGEFHLRRA